MNKQKIFLVEDDKHISKLVRYSVEKAGFECSTAPDGEAALEALGKEQPDLIILDIMLPKMDGFEVCRVIKQDARLKSIPVVMLTAKGEEVDRVVGLELGADDYVVKPFSPRELVLRIKAILRRSKAEEPEKDIIRKKDIVIDIPKHTVLAKGKEVILTPKEFKLLVTLVERCGRVQSRERLLSDVWDINSNIYTRTVDTHIKRLREKLGRAGDSIETVRSLGYKFEEGDED